MINIKYIFSVLFLNTRDCPVLVIRPVILCLSTLNRSNLKTKNMWNDLGYIWNIWKIKIKARNVVLFVPLKTTKISELNVSG